MITKWLSGFHRFRKAQSGDTLLEVAIAVSIISLILFSAYSLSSNAFKQGRIAHERSQAAQIAQAQAEGLRQLRDSAANWTSFSQSVTSLGNPFHVENNSTGWHLAAGSWNGSDIHTANPELPDFYAVSIQSTVVNATKLSFTVTVRWARFGGGNVDETSTLYYKLTDRHISF